MKRAENLNSPSLNGSMIAGGFGVLAFAVAKVVGGFDYTTAGFLAVLVAGGAAAFLVIPWGANDRIPAPEAGDDHGHASATPAPAATPVAAPAPVASAAEPASAEGTKPVALAAPRNGQADDLKKLEGIGPALEKLCNEMGIFHFDQIAAWGEAEVAWMDANLKGFKGRVTRDKWVAQARLIGTVGMDEFLRRAKTNDY